MGIATGAASIMAELKVPTTHPSIPIRGRVSPLQTRKKWFKSRSTTTVDIHTEALTAPSATHAIDAAVAVASASSSSIAFAVAWWALLSPESCSAASLSSIAIATEPTNALSLPTWAVHVSSVAEWVTAMSLVWEYGERSGFSSWKGLSWGMLCDFGLARSLADISKSSLSMLPQGKRGTPCYMAPELFQDGGVHSYVSDFWALGCVLYECYAGKPPFAGSELTQLVNSILSDPVPSLPDNSSSLFADMIERLLAKDPSDRIQWPELCEHGFWRTKFTFMPLPPRPAFDDMIQHFTKPCLSECNSDRPIQQRTPKRHEKDVTRKLKHDENYSVGAKGTTPVKGAQNEREMHAKNAGRVDDKKKEAVHATKGVNILRLSRIAKSNLQRENEKDNYRRPLPKASDNDAEVKIENNDMELDFSENHDDEAPDDSDGSHNASFAPGEDPSSHYSNKYGADVPELKENGRDVQQESNIAVPDETMTTAIDISTDVAEVAATPPSSLVHAKANTRGNIPDYDTNDDLSDAMWHQSDLSVKPVMPSRRCDKPSEANPVMPFEAPAACDYMKLSSEQLEVLNGNIVRSPPPFSSLASIPLPPALSLLSCDPSSSFRAISRTSLRRDPPSPAAKKGRMTLMVPVQAQPQMSNVINETRNKPDRPCLKCNGSGRIDCHHCRGRGRTNCVHLVMLPKGEWPKWCKTCGGSGLEYCSRCLGTGEYRDVMGFHFRKMRNN